MQTPFIPIAASFIIGIIIGSSLQIPNSHLWGALIATLILLTVAILNKFKTATFSALCLSLMLLGSLAINPYLYMPPDPIHVVNLPETPPIGLEGVVIEVPERGAEKTDLVIQATHVVQNGVGVKVTGKVLLSVNGVEPMPRYGDFIRTRVKLKQPHNFNNPGRFDYERFLRLKGILVRGYIEDPAEIIVIRHLHANLFDITIERFRDQLRYLIRHNAPQREAAVLIAMVLGEQHEIQKDIQTYFNRTGTTHILAISGFNIGIVYMIFIALCTFLLKLSKKLLLHGNALKCAVVLSAFPVILYAFIAGMGMSVLRATLMILILAVAVVWGRDRDLPNTLCLAGLAILAGYPPALFDISFQLSFVTVAAIIFIVPKLTWPISPSSPVEKLHGISRSRRVAHTFYLFVLVTTAATLGAIPLTTRYFNTFSLTVLAGNLLLIPLMGYIVTFLSIGIILFALISTAPTIWVIKLAALLIRISIAIVERLSSLSFASIYVATPTVLEIVFYVLLVIATVLIGERIIRRDPTTPFWKFRIAVATALASTLFFVVDGITIHVSTHQQKKLIVTYLDVAQGSASFVRLPGGKTILIDGGGFFNGRFDIGRNVLAPFLWHEKITAIDTVVLTHPHPDHLYGLIFILQNFAVREVFSNGQVIDDEQYVLFRRIMSEEKIAHRVMHAGQTIAIGPAIMSIDNPLPKRRSAASLDADDDLNDNSLVVRLSYGRVSFLFPGDISSAVEARLLKQHWNIRADILLAPHHGSRFSNSLPFLKRVHPQIAVFSCGRDNVFGLPHQEILKRYAALGIDIRRTDQEGAITIETDRKRITSVTSFLYPDAEANKLAPITP